MEQLEQPTLIGGLQKGFSHVSSNTCMSIQCNLAQVLDGIVLGHLAVSYVIVGQNPAPLDTYPIHIL